MAMLRRIAIAIVLLSGAAIQCQKALSDLADIPPPVRQQNWTDPSSGEGSCLHASLLNAFRWVGRDDLAEWWPYQGGEYRGRIQERLDQAGVQYVVADNGEVEVLEWAAKNRLIVAIAYYPYHAINLVDLTATHAILLDNNRTNAYIYVPRETFVQRWRNEFGGFAIVVIGSPAPPWPQPME